MYITKMPIISFWLVHCTEDPVLYFAEVLEKALDKSNSKTVTRIIVTRAEVCRAPTTPSTFLCMFVALDIFEFLALFPLVK